jgi:hypothetical protein
VDQALSLSSAWSMATNRLNSSAPRACRSQDLAEDWVVSGSASSAARQAGGKLGSHFRNPTSAA